ncbi:MAG: hypothetical protein ACRD3S_16195, partial [Terracidiphilus sp.]
PNLKGSSAKFIAVRGYFFVVKTLGRVVPNVAKWAETEMIMCSTYMAAVLEQHLQCNMECVARLQSM